MNWELLAIILTNASIFLWMRSEASSDRRETRAEIQGLAQAIHEEMKDFHGRLCALEEKYKSIKDRK